MFTLEEKLGYRFKNRALLENALQHSSYANTAARACAAMSGWSFWVTPCWAW